MLNVASNIVGISYIGLHHYCYVPEGHHMIIQNNLELFDKEQVAKE